MRPRTTSHSERIQFGADTVERGRMGMDGTDIYSKWQAMKAVGLPVVPMMNPTDRDTVEMTHLTADGSILLGRHYLYDLQRSPDTRLSDQDRKFCQWYANPANKDQLRGQLESIATTATQNNIVLAEDGPFDLLFRPDGSAEPMVVDIELTKLNSQDQMALELNAVTVPQFMDTLDAIFAQLTKR